MSRSSQVSIHRLISSLVPLQILVFHQAAE
jgi:hypothetical protein